MEVNFESNSGLCFRDKRLSYCGQDCNKIPQSLGTMYGDKAQCLDLSYNSLVSLKGLEVFTHLEDLILDNNKLTDSVIFPHLPLLKTLSLNNNQITDVELLLDKIDKSMPTLTYLSLLSNKACPNQLSDKEKDDSDYQRYRYFVLHKLPKLRFLDSRRVSSGEVSQARARGQFMCVHRPAQPTGANDSDATTPHTQPTKYNALPPTRTMQTHKGAYGKYNYKYTGKHSEGPNTDSVLPDVNCEYCPSNVHGEPLTTITGLNQKLAPERFASEHFAGDTVCLPTTVECVVNYEYTAVEPDELSLRVGEVVREVERLSGGWWRGELHGRRGMFPDNFVTVRGKQDETPVLRNNSPKGRCRAVFSYQAANPDELSLSAGDVLEVLGEVEEGWWQGRSKSGKTGVFPSNFVVPMDPPITARVVSEQDAPSLPPKPVKEQCRVLFPYTAVNEDEITLAEGEIVNIVSRDGPDRGWWRGELRGRVGLFPDNFVAIIPSNAPTEIVEKKPERPPVKNLTPILHKFSETTSSIKEITSSRISLSKENSLKRESHKDSSISHKETSSSHKETTSSSSKILDTDKNAQQDKLGSTDKLNRLSDSSKPPVPIKKSPTPASTVGSIFSGLKSKMLPSSDNKDKDKSLPSNSSSPEWDRPDGISPSRLSVSPLPHPLPTLSPPRSPLPAARGDGFELVEVERNSMLIDPRAGRVKAPRRRPPSQALRDDIPVLGLSNGTTTTTATTIPHNGEKAEEIKPKSREWEKHKAPWMEELKLNQAKKTTTSIAELGKAKSVSDSQQQMLSKVSSGSTERILDCVEERKRESTHSMEMSKSMSSITTNIMKMETFDEVQIRKPSRDSVDANTKKGVAPTTPTHTTAPTHAPEATPTAADRTSVTTDSSNTKINIIDVQTEPSKTLSGNEQDLISQLSKKVSHLEQLLHDHEEIFRSTVSQLTTRLDAEVEARRNLQLEVYKLKQCVTQV